LFAVSRTVSQSRASSYTFNDPLVAIDSKESSVNQSSEVSSRDEQVITRFI